MKRDKNLIREILEYVRDNHQYPEMIKIDKTEFLQSSKFSTQDFELFAHHFLLTVNKGLLSGNVNRDAANDKNTVSTTGLTWEGYDYLEVS